MSTNSTQVGDYCWCPRSFVLGGHWNDGAMAGLFALDPLLLAAQRQWLALMGCVGYPAQKEPDCIEPTYPAFIPRRWIYLSEHAKKKRTRKKWKHAIARKIELYKKRNKGAIA